MNPIDRLRHANDQLAYDIIRRTDLDPWQDSDGFPADAYFQAVAVALAISGVEVEDWGREEVWEVNYSLAYRTYADGPLGWAEHGLYVSWVCGQDDEPKHADDFTGIGWYWVPYTDPNTAAGDFAKKFEDLPYLAEPGQVAAAVAELIGVTR